MAAQFTRTKALPARFDLRWNARAISSLYTTSPFRMARQDQRSRRPATRRTLLPTAGYLTSVAPASTAGSVAGEQEAAGMVTASSDSWDRPDPRGLVDCADPDTSSVPHQTTTMDL